MEPEIFDYLAPKKPTNVSINSDLLARAKSMKINLSRTLENALIDMLRTRQQQQWLDENRDALEQYNRRIAKHGAFSNGLRKF